MVSNYFKSFEDRVTANSAIKLLKIVLLIVVSVSITITLFKIYQGYQNMPDAGLGRAATIFYLIGASFLVLVLLVGIILILVQGLTAFALTLTATGGLGLISYGITSEKADIIQIILLLIIVVISLLIALISKNI